MNVIKTDKAPKPIGAYSQAAFGNGMLYISGQIAIDPETGEMISGNFREETKRVMDNIKAILNAAGLTFLNVVKVSIFTTDLDKFDEINEVYGSYFEGNFPARETIEVSRLPKNANVEISVIATTRQEMT